MIIVYVFIILLFLLLYKKQEFFENLKSKKKCLIGFLGLYRTFEKTSDNIFKNIINNNQDDYDFTIIINTDNENKEISHKPYLKKKFNYNKSELYYKLKKKYNRNNQLKKIIYFNNKDKNIGGTVIFRKRIKQIFEYSKSKYDLYIFIRLDAEINKPINLNLFSENKLYTITNLVNINNKRFDHNRDWDFCWLGNRKVFDLYFNQKSIVTPSIKELIELIKKTGIKSQYIKNFKKDNNSPIWVYRNLIKYYNMYKNGVLMDFNSEEKNIFTYLVRK